ncbi:ankyrin repeat domain-containing protein [Candidatus Tisiphia endosymbiont of Temnostethus pusillus]|uniref:ankyrin repeat domain-containing protein n=1 Tax=Candidatus Tisiphia endosymbiont of Temnostethus pusillus TaxID=3139335 RepID=UPI0035C8870E
MGRVIITEEELDFCKSNKVFLNRAFIAAVRARDVTALELLFKSTDLKSCLDIKQIDLFGELLALVIDDKNLGILELIVDKLKLHELKQQKIPETQETLLDIATRYRAEGIVAFLLTVGLDPNNKDNNGQTSLHKAVMANSLDIISLIINGGAIVNIQDRTDGNTPLHLATLLKFHPIVQKLKFHGAQEHIKNKAGYNYSTLHKLVVTGKAKLDIKAPPPPEIDEDLEFYKGITSFYRAVLSEGNKEEYFASAIDDIKSFINQLPNSPKKIEPINRSLELLVKLYQYYKYEDSAELQKYIIDKAVAHELPTISIVLYNVMCVEHLRAADYHNAIKYAEYAHNSLLNSSEKLQTETYKGSLYEILFNLGLAWKHLDTTKSLDYFAQAEETKPSDQDAIIEKLKHYLTLVDIDNASKQIGKINDSDLRDLYEIMLNNVKTRFKIIDFTPDASSITLLKSHAQEVKNPMLKNLSNIMLEFASKPDASLSQLLSTFFQNNTLEGLESYLEIYKEIWVRFFLQKKEFGKAIECCDEINICMEEHNVPTQLFKILEICKEAGLWDKGLKFIEEKYQKHNEILQHHGFLPLKYLEFVFYKQHEMEEESEACLNFLKTNAHLGDKPALLLSYANEFAFYIDVEKGNFDQARSYLQNSTSLDLSTIGISKIFILLIERLQALQKEILLVQSAIADTTEEGNIVSIDLIKEPDELNDFIANLDPKAIHAYFQQQKQALLKKSVDTAVKEQPSIWCIGKDTYTSNQQDVYPIEDKPNFYVTIDRKLAGKLDHPLLKKFEAAISKGLISKYDSTGIKIVPNKFMEAKIFGDDERLYTDQIYKDPQGNYLICFNKQGNHKETKKAARESKLKIIYVDGKTSYLASLPKESECSTSTQELDLDLILAMSLQEHEEMKVLGVNDD